MNDRETDETASLFPVSVGEKLRAARLSQGLELAQVAQTTRIPQRHLETIEESNFGALPSHTYAMGFTKAYARAVGLDEVAIARDLRAEIGKRPERAPVRETFAIEDSGREPPSWIAWVGTAVAVIALVFAILWYGTNLFRGQDVADAPVASDPALVAPAEQPAQTAPAAAPTPAGAAQVTLTATQEVWVRVYDGAGQTLLQKTMAAGERYDVPANANNPMINIGRPEAVAVTINGSSVPPLGEAGRAVKDVGISAEALRARAAPAPGGSAG